MNIKPAIALTALAFVTGGVVAQDAAPASITRADVRQSVLDARASNALTPAGEAATGERASDGVPLAPSSLSRATEEALVRQARAAGTLMHAGPTAPEDEMKYARAHPSMSDLGRAEVRNEVLQARAAGTLIPPGQGEDFNGGAPTEGPRLAASMGPAGDGGSANRGE